MIHYLKHEEINKEKWDEVIRFSPNSLIYAYSWYLDIVAPHWDALVNDDFTSVMPLTRKKKWGIHYLYPPHFTQQLGVFSLNPITAEEVDNFIEAIPSKFRYIEILLNSSNKLNKFNNSIQFNYNYELLLNCSYEEHYKGYSENTRRSLKKAEDYSLEVVMLEEAADVIRLFRNNRGKNISNLKAEEYELFRSLCLASAKKKKIEISGVKIAEQLVAGLILLRDNNRVIFIFSATNDIAKEKRAMFFLIDHFIRKNADSGVLLDFEGSNNEALARFYKSFGAINKFYPKLKINRLPWPFKIFKQ